jgi:hypothetical protein
VRRRTEPRQIEAAYDETSDLVWIRFTDTGHEYVRDGDWLANQVLDAINDPSSVSELTAAQLHTIVGDERWRQAEQIAAALKPKPAAADRPGDRERRNP